MRRSLKILLAGESWITHTHHIKGVDHFTQSGYGEGTKWLRRAFESAGHTLEHVPNHLAGTSFPATVDQMATYDVVILSDIGANTLLLHPDTSERSVATPNRLDAIERYVSDGGGLLMIGGYMSFEGIEGKARYAGTAVERALPVTLQAGRDDRLEVPEGFIPRVTAAGQRHPITRNLPTEFPFMLFRNVVTAKPEATVLVQHAGEPVLAIGDYGAGRAAAFTPDAAPHGAPPEFLEWRFFDGFWCDLANWLAGANEEASE